MCLQSRGHTRCPRDTHEPEGEPQGAAYSWGKGKNGESRVRVLMFYKLFLSTDTGTFEWHTV